MQIFIKILKIIVGIILGLVFSFLTIVCLEIFLSKPNLFGKLSLNLWLVGPIVACWLFVSLWLMLKKPSTKKIQTPGIENLPESISVLIDAIIDTMRYKQSVRAEVRQELADHFIDALADCDDDAQKQECAKKLIEAFGDTQLLGTLIRRGKKRCRPLWQKILSRIPHAIGISILLLVLYIGWFFTGKPEISTNYLEIFNQQARPVVDDNLNAWSYYEQAAQNYVKRGTINKDTGSFVSDEERIQTQDYSKEDFIELDSSPRSLKTLSKPELKILEQWISDNHQAIDLIGQGNQKPYYWRNYSCDDEDSTEIINVMLPDLSELRDIGRLFCWHAMGSADKGNFDNAFNHLFECYLLGQHVRGQNTTLIEQLVGIAIENLSTKALRTLLYEYSNQIDANTLAKAQKLFEQMIEREDFVMDLKGEKLFLYDEAQRCFTQSRFGKSHLYLPRLEQLGFSFDDEPDLFLRYGFSILFTHPDKEETLKTVDIFYNKMDSIALQTPATQQANEQSPDQFIEETIEDNLLLNIMIPALGRVIELPYRNQIDVQTTLVILLIAQYHKKHGQYPDSLQTLVETEDLKEIPIDPFSDKVIAYRKTKQAYTLYSFGTNCIDDNGQPWKEKDGDIKLWHHEGGDAVFWPVNE